jgi:hypothetical protein
MAVTFSSIKDIELMMLLSKLAVSLSVMAFAISLIFLLKIINLEKQLKGKLKRNPNLERLYHPKTEFYIAPPETKVPFNQGSQYQGSQYHAQNTYQTLERTIAVPHVIKSNRSKKNPKKNGKLLTILLLIICLCIVCTVVVFQLGDLFGMSNYPHYLWLIIGFILLAIGTISEELFLR